MFSFFVDVWIQAILNLWPFLLFLVVVFIFFREKDKDNEYIKYRKDK